MERNQPFWRARAVLQGIWELMIADLISRVIELPKHEPGGFKDS
jgi:hypothetical protein